MDRALLIMAKRPLPGRTKTRLCPPLTPEQAAALYDCLLRDTVEVVGMVPNVTPYIAWAPHGDEAYFRQVAPGFRLIRQEGEGLSERLDHVLSQASAAGFEQVVAINSDSPDLPAPYLVEAFEHFNDPDLDVVLGPTFDGGYYLIGWKRPNPRLVREVTMSTDLVLADTLSIARQEKLKVGLLPPWHDIDEVADVVHLRARLINCAGVARFTAGFLEELALAQGGPEWLNGTSEVGA